MLINDQYYFVLHAPRQSGKTTTIEELICHINGNGTYSIFLNVEGGQAAHEKCEGSTSFYSQFNTNQFGRWLEYAALVEKLGVLLREQPVIIDLLYRALKYWSQSASKPIVLFIDEIDALIGDSLLSVLRQIRTGFKERPKNFPQSICLIGLRDVRDYKVWSKEAGHYVSAASPFNVKAISLLLANFSYAEVRALYEQHTQETGQRFTDEAIEYAFFLTQGQPWLVNALAQEACFEMIVDRTMPITKQVIEDAKDVLILRRDTRY